MNIIKLNFPYSQTKNWIPLDFNNVTKIIIHHIKAITATPEDINKWHLIDNSWNGGFGYNEYIRKDGTVYIGRGDNMGSHCQGHNSTSYGISCEGDYENEIMMPKEQKEALIERIKFNKSRFPKVIGVFPHSYFGSTSCPGKYFPLAEILKKLETKKEVDKNYKNCVDLVCGQLKLNTPEYWYHHQDPFIAILITKMANRLYELTEV
jgi:hypothetical protein